MEEIAVTHSLVTFFVLSVMDVIHRLENSYTVEPRLSEHRRFQRKCSQ
jgi:hypothetical protein